jgi:hypothetical protein
MQSRDLAIILFNQKMDRLIENVLTSKSGTPEGSLPNWNRTWTQFPEFLTLATKLKSAGPGFEPGRP